MTAILDRYEPDLLILQDTSPNGTRRIERLARLNATIESTAQDRRIRVFRYSRDEVYGTLRAFGVSNKQQLAQFVAKHIPAFERFVPPPRRPWMTEDTRMALFDAAALGIVFFVKSGMSILTQ
jgi:hypothetical protein